MMQPSVVVIGAASLDMKGRSDMPLVAGTSNPGSIRISPGGVGRNVAENLARLGVSTMLLSAVGDDSVGKYLLDATNAGGVDVSRLIVSSEFPSASYLAVVDHNGNPVLSIDDMHIMELVTPKHIYANRKWITGASMVVLDGNLSPASIKSAVSVAAKASVPVCVDPASVALSPRVSPHLSQLFMVVPNQAEAEALSGVPSSGSDQATAAAQRLVSMGVNTAVITLAEKGLVYATSEETGRVPAMHVEVTDPTGGGDALTGALVFGLVNGFSVSEAARLGVSAAALTLSSTDTVCPDLSLERLYDQLMI